nr:MAG TPA: hypothetical protein [Myoviridae sp. ctTS62]
MSTLTCKFWRFLFRTFRISVTETLTSQKKNFFLIKNTG